MANRNATIAGIVAGDDFEIIRTITGVPAGDTLAKAWLTVKEAATDLDPGVLQKAITSTNVAGTGQITDTGADMNGALRFDLVPADTMLLAPGTPYVYDIQVKTAAGKVYTAEIGTITTVQGVTATMV